MMLFNLHCTPYLCLEYLQIKDEEIGNRQKQGENLLRKMDDEIVAVNDNDETEATYTIPQIAIMGRGMEQLTPEQRTLVVDMMRPLFKSYFNVDLPTEDNV